ncbi:contact-dependent growth inhibition system immunity protein [Leeuwenhoekiella marinoflava]|uniref:contact-dependent growth inhibition system immunity protein n=1 Tax=Leeuwenhoekiella marinoflava TaxID=988 RepID=UPI0030024BE3
MRDKSLEQLEKDSWREPQECSSYLVKRAYEYRNKPLTDLTIEEIRLLISQSIGLEHLVPLALEKLDEDILAVGDLYEGDLLFALAKIPNEFWRKHSILLTDLKENIKKNTAYIKSVIGEKKWNQLYNKLK